MRGKLGIKSRAVSPKYLRNNGFREHGFKLMIVFMNRQRYVHF